MGDKYHSDDDLVNHAADLDAHTYNLWERLQIGKYKTYPLFTKSGEISAVAMGANKLITMPLPVARAMTLDRIGVKFQAGGGAGTHARLGIYNDGSDIYPGTLLLDAGLVDSSAAAIVAITISQSLTKGLYHIAIISDGTPALYRAQYFIGMGGYASAGNYWGCGWEVAQAYGALPATFHAGAAQDATYLRRLLYRIASLD